MARKSWLRPLHGASLVFASMKKSPVSMEMLCGLQVFSLSQDVWSASGKAAIQNYVVQMIPGERPGNFNQVMMELGATVCRKTKPLCYESPLQLQCLVFTKNCIEICPPKKSQRNRVDIELFVLLL